MNKDLICTLYDYNYWAHNLVWDCVDQLTEEQFTRNLDYSWGSVHVQLVHSMSAEWMWFNRLRGTSPESMFDPADYPTRETIRARWREIEADAREYLAALDDGDLNGMFTYTTTSGNTHRQRVGEILLHVVNHATDHRAQTLAMIHEVGGPTAEQDLIFYLRERAETV